MAKILVVDDNVAFLETISLALARANHSVKTAESIDGTRTVLSNDPSIGLILLDFWLDKGTGLELLPSIWAVKPELPVIFMSGGGSTVSLETTTALAEMKGAVGFLYKPFSNADMFAEIDRVLAQSSNL